MRTRQERLEVPGSISLFQVLDPAISWTRLYEQQIRQLPKMDRAEEFRMARRYEFMRLRLEDALARAGVSPDEECLRKARAWINTVPAAEVAAAEAAHFPGIDLGVLAETIGFYQQLGCWSPHVEITRQAFEVTCDVYRNIGRAVEGDAYAAVVAAPPA